MVTTLTYQLSQIEPFTISFNKNSVGTFSHGRNSTMWVKPLLPDAELQKPSVVPTKPSKEKQEKTKVKEPKKPKPKKVSLNLC